MNNPARSSAWKILLLVAVLLPVFILFMAGAGLSGFAGINPDNHGKTLVYPVSDQQAELVKKLSVYLMVPLAILTGILAILNIKLSKQQINKTVLILCGIFVGWLVFSFWALDEKYVSEPDSKGADQPLQIRSINLQ